MPASEQLRGLVAQLPDPDPQGLLSAIDKERVEATIAAIHQGGRENVLGLIDLLVPPGQGDDVKAHYGIHCLAVHVCTLEDREPRRVFAEAVASQLGGTRPKPVQAYLCHLLQVAGGPQVAPALGRLLTDEELCEPAAMALTAIGEGAADQFRAALPNARGRCRLTVIQNLGVVRDAKAVDALQPAVADADRDIRIAAGWALANIGDPGAVDILIRASNADPGWERIQMTKACLVLAERLIAAGRQADARRLYTHLSTTRTDASERYVREAAERGLTAAR